MRLSPRQQRALASICETFFPAADGWPSASELHISAAIAEALDFNPRSRDRAEFLRLLDFWDSRLHSFLTAGRLSPFSSLPNEIRRRILLSWRTARSASGAARFRRCARQWDFSM